MSRAFYEKLGDDIANELVNLHCGRNVPNRSERNNFERLDARLEQRLAEWGATIRAEMHSELALVREEMADLRTDMVEHRGNLAKWMFIFWTGTAVTNVGIMFALVKMIS